jgi:hypothetical protein
VYAAHLGRVELSFLAFRGTFGDCSVWKGRYTLMESYLLTTVRRGSSQMSWVHLSQRTRVRTGDTMLNQHCNLQQ